MGRERRKLGIASIVGKKVEPCCEGGKTINHGEVTERKVTYVIVFCGERESTGKRVSTDTV